MAHYDIAVLGLGIVGSSILARLSKDYNAVGIDQFSPPHTHGSSHGENRIIRGAPAEGLIYAQMAAKSFEMFEGLSKTFNRPLIHKTGGVDCSTQPDDWAQTVKKTCEGYNMPFTEMDGQGFNALYPNFNLPADAQVILQPQFGHVNAELSWQTFMDIAVANKAETLLNKKIKHVDLAARNTVTFEDGSKITADKVIYAAGSWMNSLLDIELNLKIGRRVLAWYEIENPSTGVIPFIFVDGQSGHPWYGMPSVDGKHVKIGEHHHLSEETDPDRVTPPGTKDSDLLSSFVRDYMQGVNPDPVRMAACKYTLTHDDNFIMDRHPRHDNVFIFSCCSGHGFKYAPLYGEIARSFVDGTPYDLDLSLFKVGGHIVQPAKPSKPQPSSPARPRG